MVTATLAALCCVAALAGAPTIVMAPLGIALIAAPGYIWAEVLLGSRLRGLERVVVAAGVALAVPVIGGVVLSLGGLPLHRADWIGLFTVMTLAGDAVLLARWKGAAGSKGLTGWSPSGWTGRAGRIPALWQGLRARHVPARHAVAFGAAVLIAAAGLGVARWGAAVQQYPGFTQLWLAPLSGHPATEELGVSNHQGTTMRYRLVLELNGHAAATWDIILAGGQTWRRAVAGTGAAGIDASLYRLPDLTHPYRQVFTASGRGVRS